MRLKLFFTTIISLLYFFTAFAQSGWTKEKGKYFTKLDFSYFSASKYYNPSGNLLNTNAFNQNSLNFYGEYGVTDKLNIIASMPLLRANSFAGTETVYGNGDLKLELKYRPTNRLPLAISIAPEFPTGRKNAFAKSKDSPLESINLPTGDGEFNVWSTLALSVPFSSKAYVSAFGAYNYRTKYDGLDFTDLYQIGFEAGYNPIQNLWLNAKLRGQFSTGESRHPELSFVRGDATTYTLASVEAFYKLNNQLGVSATFLTGNEWLAKFKNIYIAPFFSIGVIYERK